MDNPQSCDSYINMPRHKPTDLSYFSLHCTDQLSDSLTMRCWRTAATNQNLVYEETID
jgi:hypothetical protein